MTIKVKHEELEEDESLTVSPRRKRRKVTTKSTPQKEEVPNELGQLSHLKNAKVKKKKNDAREFAEDSVVARLKPIGLELYPIALDAALLGETFTRPFISSLFGGGVQNTFSTTGDSFLKTHPGVKKRRFMNLKLDWNPHAPQVPGAPGLFFGGGSADWTEGAIETVLICLEPGHWLYVGEYQMGRTNSLSVEEWKSQSNSVKAAWCNGILKFGWGKGTRVRCALRKQLRRKPTKDEINAGFYTNMGDDMTPEEIQSAFDAGDEDITIWTMKCVGYDEDIQIAIADAENREAFERKEAAARKKSNKRSKKTKVKNEPLSDSEPEADAIKDEAEDGSDFDNQAIKLKKSAKKSNKRPKKEEVKEESLPSDDEVEIIDVEEDEEEYQVEKIVAQRKRKAGGGLEYKVRWKGWKAESDTWEPHERVEDLVAYEDWLKKNGR